MTTTLLADAAPETLNRYLRHKDRLSPVVAAALALLLAPIILFLYVLVRLTSPGPGFYSQVRLGRGGRRFTIYKLRTMVVDAEARTGPVWASERDPRVTRVGRFLRATHLDELPQIFNVIKGDMCFVGPRPERPEIAAELAKDIPHYLDRLAVKPGVTGMAQIHLPPDTSVASVRKKLRYDLAYLWRGSLLLDAGVVLVTCVKSVPFGAKLRKQLGAYRTARRQARRWLELPAAPRHAVALADEKGSAFL